MAFVEGELNNREIYDLLIRIDEGYSITDDEKKSSDTNGVLNGQKSPNCQTV